MKYTSFTKANLGQFRKEFQELVRDFESEKGVKIDLGGINFDASQFTTKTTVTIIQEGMNPQESKDRKSLKDYGHYYELSEEDYGGEIVVAEGNKARIVAVNPKAPKYPIIYEMDGKRYKCKENRISAYLINRKK